MTIILDIKDVGLQDVQKIARKMSESTEDGALGGFTLKSWPSDVWKQRCSNRVCTAISPFLGTALAMSSVSETRNPGSKSLMLEGEGLMD